MGAGRPTKYNDAVLEKTQDYIKNFKSYGDMVPSVAGLADELGVARETVYDWCRQPEKCQFSDIVKRISTKQERELINGTLSGEFNAQVGRMMLGKHGYTETSQIDNISSDGSMATGKPTKIELVAYEAPSVGSTD
jgi:serine protease inhibitor